MKQPSELILRLCKKIKDEIGWDCDPTTFRRTRAGYWQRSMGAWSWYIQTRNSHIDVGSSDTVTECVKDTNKLVRSGNEIYTENKTIIGE